MKAARIAALATLAAGAAIGLAGPANAELQDGSYTQTVTESDTFVVGQAHPWNVSDCGPDCKRVTSEGQSLYDFHRQGNTWTSSAPETAQAWGYDDILDNDSLAGTLTNSDGSYFKYQLKKN